jgi:hypothetical protein
MEMLHDARFYEPLPGGEVLCTFCPACKTVVHNVWMGPGRNESLRAVANKPAIPAPEHSQWLRTIARYYRYEQP